MNATAIIEVWWDRWCTKISRPNFVGQFLIHLRSNMQHRTEWASDLSTSSSLWVTETTCKYFQHSHFPSMVTKYIITYCIVFVTHALLNPLNTMQLNVTRSSRQICQPLDGTVRFPDASGEGWSPIQNNLLRLATIFIWKSLNLVSLDTKFITRLQRNIYCLIVPAM